MSEFFTKTKRGRGRAKHGILDRYLKAFFAIQCQSRQWRTPIVYIDGFAGPGTYQAEDSSEEIGSPIIAYKAATEHTLIDNFRAKGNTILLIFIEKDIGNSRKLENTLTRLHREKTETVRSVVHYRVVNGDFKNYLEQVISSETGEFVHSPMFVFADPFGYKGDLIPMVLFKALMERQDGRWLPTEVFITVMDGFARRFISDSRVASAINALMGYKNWHHLTEQGHDQTAEERRNAFIQLYIDNLKRDMPKSFVLKFGMRSNRNCHVYHLVFLTCHISGIKKMKEAMWRQTQSSTEMVFSEWVENRDSNENIVEKSKEQVAQCLFELMKNAFSGLTVKGSELERFIWLETPYISNVKINLKKLLKPYAINHERAFEKIKYQFTDEPNLLKLTENDDRPDEIDEIEGILSELVL